MPKNIPEERMSRGLYGKMSMRDKNIDATHRVNIKYNINLYMVIWLRKFLKTCGIQLFYTSSPTISILKWEF